MVPSPGGPAARPPVRQIFSRKTNGAETTAPGRGTIEIEPFVSRRGGSSEACPLAPVTSPLEGEVAVAERRREGGSRSHRALATRLVSRRPLRYITARRRVFAKTPRSAPRRGGRAVECTALEMRHTGNRIGGSNPSLSAKLSTSRVDPMAKRAQPGARRRPKSSSRRTRTQRGDSCTIPPAIPHEQLPDLLFRRDRAAERSIREYVEWQVRDEKVVHAEKVATEVVMGRKLEAWDVRTDKGRWWVVASPTNLYSQQLFPSLDYTISFHVGVTTRMMSEPDPGVHPMEQMTLAPAWRRWEQAAEAFQAAEEAEEFQAVGMRCRECLILMVKSGARLEMIDGGSSPPKASDVQAWSEIIANHVAKGTSAKEVRGYLKSMARSTWQLVNWLTHSSSATKSDASLALDATQHVLAAFTTALFRFTQGLPDRCPDCGSYKVGMRYHPDEERVDLVPGCEECGWWDETRGRRSEGLGEAEGAVPGVAGFSKTPPSAPRRGG